MLKNSSLQTRLVSAFLFIGVIVLVVALVGWNVNARLSNALDTLSTNSMPSIMGLWKINEGQTQVESSERALLNDQLTLVERNAEVARIQKAWEQIDYGLKQYEPTPKSDEEKKIYADFQKRWDEWKKNHETFMQLNKQFESLGIISPNARELALIKLNQANSPEIGVVKKAGDFLTQLRQKSQDNRPSFEAATKLLIENINQNEKFGTETYKQGQKYAATGSFVLLLTMVIGPMTAFIFGVNFTKPLNSLTRRLQKSGIQITTSSTQIAASGKELEATVTEQLAST
ncbi:MAG: MCP four helix bundle domain-containing protein, partial [Nostocales cyanobacterium ELA583]